MNVSTALCRGIYHTYQTVLGGRDDPGQQDARLLLAVLALFRVANPWFLGLLLVWQVMNVSTALYRCVCGIYYTHQPVLGGRDDPGQREMLAFF